MIRPYDLVRLIRAHEWFGRVLRIEGDEAMVLSLPTRVVRWMPLEFLELRPGQEEEMAA